jgi:hypothetical protein
MLPKTEPQGSVSRAWKWGELILAILAGNILYLLIEPELPMPLRHGQDSIGPGSLVDFLLCALIYGLVRLARRI